jgi:hypothetical protein
MDVIATLAADADAVAKTVKADVATARADIRSVLTSRFNDAILVIMILGSIWIGHALS